MEVLERIGDDRVAERVVSNGTVVCVTCWCLCLWSCNLSVSEGSSSLSEESTWMTDVGCERREGAVTELLAVDCGGVEGVQSEGSLWVRGVSVGECSDLELILWLAVSSSEVNGFMFSLLGENWSSRIDWDNFEGLSSGVGFLPGENVGSEYGHWLLMMNYLSIFLFFWLSVSQVLLAQSSHRLQDTHFQISA